MYYIDHFTALVRAVSLLYERGLCAPGDCWATVRLEGRDLLAAPAGAHPRELSPEGLVETTLDERGGPPALELHRALHRAYGPGAVLSAAPEAAGAFLLCGPERLLGALPGEVRAAEAARAAGGDFLLPDAEPGLLLAGELGLFALGDSPLACAGLLERVEYACRTRFRRELLEAAGALRSGKEAG